VGLERLRPAQQAPPLLQVVEHAEHVAETSLRRRAVEAPLPEVVRLAVGERLLLRQQFRVELEPEDQRRDVEDIRQVAGLSCHLLAPLRVRYTIAGSDSSRPPRWRYSFNMRAKRSMSSPAGGSGKSPEPYAPPSGRTD